MMEARSRLMISGVIASVLTGIGYVVAVFIPGVGDTTVADYKGFYSSDSRQAFALLLLFVLTAGCLAMLWFFNELRARFADGILVRLGFTAAVVGTICLPIGASVMGGASGAAQSLDGASVDPVIADAFAKAGLSIMLLVGMGALSLAVLMLSVAAWRAGSVSGTLFGLAIVLFVVSLASFFWIPGYATIAWVLMMSVRIGLSSTGTAQLAAGIAAAGGGAEAFALTLTCRQPRGRG